MEPIMNNPSPPSPRTTLDMFVKALVGLGYATLLGWLCTFGNLAWYLAHQQPPAAFFHTTSVLLSLGTLPLLLGYVVLAFLRRGRFLRMVIVPFCLLALALLAILDFSGVVRQKREETCVHRFRRVATTAQPLVEAIQRYQFDHGVPPSSLERLVPNYLPAIPATGVWSDRQFHYFTPYRRTDSRSWLLFVNASHTMMVSAEYRYIYPPSLATAEGQSRATRKSWRFEWMYIPDDVRGPRP